MGIQLDELLTDEDDLEKAWLPHYADGTRAFASIPFSGLFDGPEIPSPQ